MPAGIKERKGKFTASVKEKLIDLLDKKVAQLHVNRSDAVEQAIELWLKKQAEADEETYFAAIAQEMNDDARQWNATTTDSAKRNW